MIFTASLCVVQTIEQIVQKFPDQFTETGEFGGRGANTEWIIRAWNELYCIIEEAQQLSKAGMTREILLERNSEDMWKCRNVCTVSSVEFVMCEN